MQQRSLKGREVPTVTVASTEDAEVVSFFPSWVIVFVFFLTDHRCIYTPKLEVTPRLPPVRF